MMKILFFALLISVSLQAVENDPWGRDADLFHHTEEKLIIDKEPFSAHLCQSMIRFFQVYISPIDGPRSSYFPTSSEYMRQAIKKYGVLRGIPMGCDRLLRENKDAWVYSFDTEHGLPRKIDPVR